MADMAAVWQARTLLRTAKSGVLATSAGGQPFAALMTPACAPDLSVLLLLSGLSEHTRHLRDDPRCALMVAGDALDLNPQTAPRLTVLGRAQPEPDPALKARWIARHPYAGFYAGLADFRLVRVMLTGGNFIGGFASAHRLTQAELTPDSAAVAAVAAAEADILAEANGHGEALDRIAGSGNGWRMTAADVDGCDLTLGEEVRRVAWPTPVSGADGVRAELARLGEGARSTMTTSLPTRSGGFAGGSR